jgi:hypothetical protein
MASEPMSGIEKRKLTIDLLKHTSTLSASAILIIVAFMDDYIGGPDSAPLIWALICFLLSILGSFFAMWKILSNIQNVIDLSKLALIKIRTYLVMSIFGFCLGTMCLVYFAYIGL